MSTLPTLALILLLACDGDEPPSPGDSEAEADTDADADSDTDADADADADADSDTDSDTDTDVAAAPATHHARDYGYLFWPGNHWTTWGTYAEVQHVQTGFYGLAFDRSSGQLAHLGALGELDRESAQQAGNELIEALPSATLRYSAVLEGEEQEVTAFLSSEGSASNPSELVDMGRFMQRVRIPQLVYAGEGLEGSLELAAMPRHLVLTHTVSEGATSRIELSGEFLEGLDQSTWLEEGRALSVHDDEGHGWSFIVHEGSAQRSEEGALIFEAEASLSVIVVPTEAASEAQLELWLHPGETLGVHYAQLQRDGSGGEELLEADYDPTRGVYLVRLRDLSEVGAPAWADWSDPDQHTWYNRHRLLIDNQAEEAVSVPLAFEGGNNAAFYIVGGSPMLRDPQGEPTGLPVQISKNWHETPYWYHLYSAPLVEPGELELEHTFAHSKWGEAYAAAHAQLSLVGWGHNQQWDESSLGAFGESITYDPDFTLGRSMVDDVRPFLVDAAGEWSWTGNVGGANFLVVQTSETDSRPEHQLERLRTDYALTGPNLTRVVYAGQTRDGAIEATITTQLGRTDDLVRVWYHLEYSFLEDVEYERLALFQMAADRYADNGFSRYAYGEGSEVLVDAAIEDHGTTGYASEEHRGIALEGEQPWTMLYASTHDTGSLPEHLANVGFVVREYEARIGAETVTTPHINLMRTHNGGWSQLSFELGLPYDAEDRVVPAGSSVRATVEYVVPPSDKAAWYGEADWLSELSEESFQSTEMLRTVASEGALEVSVSTGELLRTYPVELMAEPGQTAVEFGLEGGLGYVPVTVRGLARPEGWRLEQELEGSWAAVDQSVEGSDWWQAHYDEAAGSYELIYNLPNRGEQRYRLVR